MPSERLSFEFPDGDRERRQPGAVPRLEDKVIRRARVWTVGEVHDRGDVSIVTVQRADRKETAA